MPTMPGLGHGIHNRKLIVKTDENQLPGMYIQETEHYENIVKQI